MKKMLCMLLAAGLLCGGCATETFETVSDELIQPVMAPMAELTLELPDHAAAPVINPEDGGKLYLCEDYTLTVQTMQGGDLASTVRTLCGFELDGLTVMQTRQEDLRRYEWVWSAAGEGEEQLCRAVLLDDGTYHYCVCAMADAALAGALRPEWDAIFTGIALK